MMTLTLIGLATLTLIALDRFAGDTSNDGVTLVVALVTLPVRPILMGWDAWRDGRQRRNCGI